MLDVPADPATTVTLVGLAATVKSWTVNVTVAECDNDPLVPVTVTWTSCAEVNVQDSVALPEPVTLVGVTEQDVLLVAKATTPENPCCAVIVMLDVAAVPAFTVTLVGLALIVKSWTVKVTVAV